MRVVNLSAVDLMPDSRSQLKVVNKYEAEFDVLEECCLAAVTDLFDEVIGKLVFIFVVFSNCLVCGWPVSLW